MRITGTIILIILFLKTYSQAVDTLQNAYAIRNTYDHIPVNGILNNGHVYGVGLDMRYNPATGAPLPIKFTRIDYTTKQVLKKEVENSISNNNGVVWRHVYDSLGRLYMGWNTANRYIIRFDLKGDSIIYKNFGNGFTGNTGTLAYSIALSPNRVMGFGGSSGPISTAATLIYENDTIRMYSELNPNQGYTYGVYNEGNYIYTFVGQNNYQLYSYDINTLEETLLATHDNIFNMGASRNGIYVNWGANPTQRLTDGALQSIPPAEAGSGTVTYRETKQFPGDPGDMPIVSTYWDAEKSTLHYTVNSVHDSIELETDTLIDGVSRMMTDGNHLYYTGTYYGSLYKYDTAQNLRTRLGQPGLNVYAMMKYNDSIIYMSGYPSGHLVELNLNQPFTAGTYYNGTSRPVSSTSNPKHDVYFRSETLAGFHHALKIVRLDNGKLGVAGPIERTATSTSFGIWNPLTREAWGHDGDKMISMGYVDIAAHRNDILFSTSNVNGGVPKLFTCNSDTYAIDSFNLGFKSYGKLIVIGDQLFGIAQDTSNSTHQIDSVRFYKFNLSTGKLIYNKMVRATLNRVSYMADGYIGINMTYTDGQIVPVDVTPPRDFYLTRKIENFDYFYDGMGGYYNIMGKIGRRNGISSYSVDDKTPQGKQKILIEMLR